MNKFICAFLGLAILLCVTATACSGKNVSGESLLPIPENITNVELSGFAHVDAIVPRTLDQAEIEELSTFISDLSLKHRTFEKGEAPGDLNGGVAYIFSFNDGETSFSWVNVGKAYIHYEGEWYEIMNSSGTPLNLPS